MAAIDVTTPTDAEALAARILSRRTRPLVLVSTSRDGEFLFDIDRLRDELADVAEVVTIETGAPSKRCESLLPDKTQAFDGAARSYPPDFADDPVWTRSRLRFPAYATTDDLVEDALGQTPVTTVRSRQAPGPQRVSGTVEGLLADASLALVRLDDGSTLTATAARLPADLPLDWALMPGATVTGIVEGSELHPEPAADPVFTDDDVTLAVVTKVTDLRATVLLHPRVAVILRRRDVTDDPDRPVGDVLHVGEVIRVRLRHDNGHLAASYADTTGVEPLVAAPALVVGGSPWLVEGRAVARLTESDEADAAHAAAATASTPAATPPATAIVPAELSHLTAEIKRLRGDILALAGVVGRISTAGAGTNGTGESARLRQENDRLRELLREERASRATAEARLAQTADRHREAGRALREAKKSAARPARAEATEASFRDEIEHLWHERTADGERSDWPLRDYALGPQFLTTFAELNDSLRTKALRACVEAITGRDREIPARDLHRLRSGDGGDDPYIVRADGARCWRSAVEQNVPGARRLHYWELAGGTIELSRIVHHDDTAP